MNKSNKKTEKSNFIKQGKDGKLKLFQFKITLDQSSPNIWRRILVPSDFSFFDLHSAIQDAMSGWLDYHLHDFAITQKGTTRPISIALPNPEAEMYEDEYLDERKEKIADYFGVKIKQCKYNYDFGDSWSHTILFEREIDGDPKEIYPKCIAGKNACPPEDCGGVGGYERLQKILKNPKHSEHKDMLDWLQLESSKDFDPTDFDIEEVMFEDPKDRLKECEENFGIEPIDRVGIKKKGKKIISPYADQFEIKDLSQEISRLVAKNFNKTGIWEIAQRPDKIAKKMLGIDTGAILNLVVHRESYFIFHMGVTFFGNVEEFKEFFLHAIEKNSAIPEILHTDDLKIIDQLKEIADAFGFEIKKEKLKVVPVVLRDMHRFF